MQERAAIEIIFSTTAQHSLPVYSAVVEDFYSRFLQSVAAWPENVAIEMRHAAVPGEDVSVERHTYSELRRMAESVGRWLLDQQMPRGARAAILAANGPRWVAAYLGIIAAGGIAVPFDTAYDSAQVAKLLRDGGAGCLFTDRKHLATAQRASEKLDLQIVLLDEENPHPSKPPLGFARGRLRVGHPHSRSMQSWPLVLAASRPRNSVLTTRRSFSTPRARPAIPGAYCLHTTTCWVR